MMDSSIFIGTWWALLPPILAIVLAFITKEVYSSLLTGIIVGVLFYSIITMIHSIHDELH